MAKVLILSSPGGHWIQAQRLIEGVAAENEVYLSSTYSRIESDLQEYPYFNIVDFSRSNLSLVPVLLKKLSAIDDAVKPDVIITTGAAPGLIAGLYWMVKKRKTVWIDSIANAERISLSGRIASYFFTVTLTQWKHLESRRIHYVGRVI